ncbi:MAG: FAD/NAD(P)-binding protein [Planctomycetia bacterium]|nr:FAD/NAD(P)-binding protein [Planctomycetia bacterium]
MSGPSSDAASRENPWRSHAARIRSIVPESPGVQTYELEFEEVLVRDSYRFAAGQFNMLYLPGIGEAAISVSSNPADRSSLAHTVRAVGNVTDALARLGLGGQVFVRGPFGTPWPVTDVIDRNVVIVAGGLGLASQRAAILFLMAERACRSVTVLHGAKRPEGLLYGREYDAWRAAGVAVHTIVNEADASWSGPVGLVTDLLTDALRDPSATTILCCGPDPMMVGVAKAAIGRGVAADDVFLSLERNMACAVAHCGLCQFGPLFVCRDGPVLPYERIADLMRIPQM